MTKINKRPLIGSLIFSTFAAVLLDYLYMGLLIALPKFSSGSMAPVIADMKQPIQLTQEAIKNPGFTQFQFVILIAFGFFVYSFYKKLNGPSKYDDASKYGSHGTAREATEREVFDEKNVVKKLKKTYLLEDVKKSFELQERINKEIEEREKSGYEPAPEIVSRISKQVLEMKRIEQKRIQQVISEAADLEENKQKEFIETEVAKIPKRYLNVSKNGEPARLSLRETDNDTLIQHIPSSQEYIREYQKKLFKPVTDRSGIILGLMNDSPVVMHQKSGWGNRNVLVVGGSGSRKTQSVGFPNVIFQTESSILVSDPKGEIFEGTAKIKEKQGYTVKVINFTNMRISNRWNPFDYIREEAEVSIVANAIVASKNNPEKKDFWYNSQYMLLRALILYVLHEVEPQKRNIEGVLDFLQEFDDEGMEDGESALDEVFMALDFKHPARIAYQLGYKKSKENTRDNIIVSLLSTLADFTSETVARFTRTSDFLLGDLGRQKIALYLIIDPLDGTWTSLINLFVSQLFRELYKVGDENNAKLYVPVSMIFDEFANLGKLPRFIEFLSTCRGYGISVMPIVQGIPQLQKLYGKEDTESIMANCTAKIVLKASDYETQKYFSNLAGKTTAKVKTGSTSTSAKSASKSDAFSYTQRDLMTPDEVKNLSNEESLIFTDSTYVIRAHKSFQYELFKDKKRLYELFKGKNRLLIDQYKMNREDFKLEQTFETKAIMQEKTQEFKEKYRENALAAVEAATAAASAIGLDEDLNAIEKELLEDEHQISVEPEQSEGKFKKLYIGVSNENLLNQEDISPSLEKEDFGPSYETAGNMEQEVLHEISTNESPAVLDETEEFLEGLTELQLSLNESEGTEVNSYPSSKIEDPTEIEDLVFELENDLNNLGTELGDLDDLYLAMDEGMENENKGGLDKKLTIPR